MIRVYFRDASSITNVSELKKYAALWYDVARGVTLAIDAKPEDVRVLSAEKGSIIINLVAITSIARILSGIILKILEITQKILEIKEQKINIEKLKIEKELIQKELDSAIKKERDEGATEICNYFVQELKIKNDGEKTQALKKSITKLIDFIEKGGSVDFVCKQNVDDDESNETERLRETTDKMLEDVERIRELEGKLLLLEEKIQYREQE